MGGKSVCLSVCQPPLAPSLLHGRGPWPRRLSPWALGTCPHLAPHLCKASRPAVSFIVSATCVSSCWQLDQWRPLHVITTTYHVHVLRTTPPKLLCAFISLAKLKWCHQSQCEEIIHRLFGELWLIRSSSSSKICCCSESVFLFLGCLWQLFSLSFGLEVTHYFSCWSSPPVHLL